MKRPDLMLVLSLLAGAGVLISTAMRAGAEGDSDGAALDAAKLAGVEIVAPKAEQNLQAMKVGELVFAQRRQRAQR